VANPFLLLRERVSHRLPVRRQVPAADRGAVTGREGRDDREAEGVSAVLGEVVSVVAVVVLAAEVVVVLGAAAGRAQEERVVVRER